MGEIVHGRAELHRHGEPLDDVARSSRDDVDAQEAPRPSVEDELVQPVLRVGVGGSLDVLEVVPDGVGVEALLTRLVLGQPELGQLGVGEDRGRERVVVG